MDEFEKFKDTMAPFLVTWNSIEVKVIADLDTSTLLSMVACLSPNLPKPLDVTDPIGDIVFIKGAIPALELATLLKGWERGVITIGRYQLSSSEFSTVRFMGLLSHPWGEDSAVGWPEFRAYRQFLIYSYGSRSVEAILGSKDITSIARVLGFTSFAELSSHRVQFQISGGYTARVEIFAPLFAVVEPKAETSRLHLNVKIHQALRTEDISLSYRAEDQKGYRLAGGPIDIAQFQRGDSEYMTILQSSIMLPSGSSSGEVHLFHRLYKSQQEPIASARFEIPPLAGVKNPQWDSVLSIIHNTRAWTKLGIRPEETIEQWLGLSQPRPKSEEFERGVAILLFAAGLPVLPLGDAEGVDQVVLVIEPSRIAVLISCTTSPDLGNKIATLSMQRNRVKEMLPDFSVHASIFAPTELRDLKLGDIEDCESQEIKVVLKAEIKTLLHEVRGIEWPQAKERLIQTLIRPTPAH